MKNQSNFVKIIVSIMAVGFIFWFVGSLLRGAIAYQVFENGQTLHIKQWLPVSDVLQTVRVYASLAIYTGIGYIVTYLLSIVLIIALRKEIKQQGWLFMALTLFLLTGVIEFYLMYYDFQLGTGLLFDPQVRFDDYIVQQFFVSRIKNLTVATMSALSALAGLTVVLFVIWMPLQKELKVKRDQSES
ncbi:MAG: hypothetical protein NT007_14775 [Candidatus Kapabacteria bacterium]|nr:hypothetical protein [Candidatus Kapabacteria bacterium]